MSQPPERQIALIALESHPDGDHWRVTEVEYSGGSALYGPALAALFPNALPVRRLNQAVLPGLEGESWHRAVWQLEGDGTGQGWRLPETLPTDLQPALHLALAPDPASRPLWQRRGGWAALMGWLDDELAAQELQRLGVPQVIKDWGISFLARVNTQGGAVYLKAVPDFFLREVAVTCALQHLLPGAAAPLLAADTRLGLMLLASAGHVLDDEQPDWFDLSTDSRTWTLDDSRAVLRHLARIQRGAEGLPLLASLPDHGPEWVLGQLPELFAGPLFLLGHPDGLTPAEAEALLALRPQLEAALARLACSPVPRTLGHGDLHEGNVLRQGDAFTVLDWSDASVSHPFLDGAARYLVPKRHREGAADAYLEAWSGLLPLGDLRDLLRDGALAGEVYRALGYTRGIQVHVADDEWQTAHLGHFRALLRLAAPEQAPLP